MKEYAIEFKHVSKIYSLKSKVKNHAMNKKFYALKDINFQIPKGEVVGILGTNGSGKSTMSLILAGISEVDEGKMIVNGEQALIAINTGLNAQLTGLENIELKGALLGLSKKRIKEITEGVIEFAEIGDFLYQPVKKYSSGMKSRLGFSINLCLNPDILIVDEALSVGDKGFAQKCIRKMKELKANPDRLAIGTVIEAELDKGRGPIATFLVQNGTLKVGDIVVCGDTWGKIRTMEDDRHTRFNSATPSTALAVTGLNAVPLAGDKFMVFADEKLARDTAEARANRTKNAEAAAKKATTLEDLFKKQDADATKELNLIIKGDVQGSVEALKASLEKINIEDLKVNIIRATVGTITDTDVSLAEASNAIIIGFNVRPMASVRNEAATKGVEIRLYNIIYNVLNDIEAALKGMLDPVYEEVVTGQAEVRSIFKLSKVGTIAGCYVTDGVIERNSLVRILRDGIVIFEGKMASLKRFKDDAKEVKQGYECGITIENFNDIKEYDVIEASVMKEVER